MAEWSRFNLIAYVVAFIGFVFAIVVTGSILTIVGLGLLDGVAVSNTDQFFGIVSTVSGSIILLGGIGAGIYMVVSDFRATLGESTADISP